MIEVKEGQQVEKQVECARVVGAALYPQTVVPTRREASRHDLWHKMTAKMAANMATEMATKMATEMATNMATEMATNMATEMATNMATEMATNMATEMATNMATEMATNMATEMATNMATEMATNMATEMATNMATEMATNMATEMATNMAATHRGRVCWKMTKTADGRATPIGGYVNWMSDDPETFSKVYMQNNTLGERQYNKNTTKSSNINKAIAPDTSEQSQLS